MTRSLTQRGSWLQATPPAAASPTPAVATQPPSPPPLSIASPTATAVAARSGVYSIDRPLTLKPKITPTGNVVVTLKTIEVMADRSLKVVLEYFNAGPGNVQLICPMQSGADQSTFLSHILLPDGTRSYLIEDDSCTTSRTFSTMLPSTRRLSYWQRFPSLPDERVPFSIVYPNLGQIDSLQLVR